MWIPRWVGEVYSQVYWEYGTELFTFEEALRLLNVPKNKLAVCFSKLRRMGILLIFRRGKPRRYRLLDPENFLLLASEKIKPISIKQEAYVKLIYDLFRKLYSRYDLVSFLVYGSVARGTARPESDLDLLVVSDDFVGSLASRIEDLITVEKQVRGEIQWLHTNGVYATLSFYPLRRSEAEKSPILFLDLVDEAKILFDKGDFMKGVLNRLNGRLIERGARKIFLEDGTWYWDLKPDYKPLEDVEI
ncbi:MAG: nucleotidyltransferase domain-containing protein [Candidatus Jordarchaeaceae archaeon]